MIENKSIYFKLRSHRDSFYRIMINSNVNPKLRQRIWDSINEEKFDNITVAIRLAYKEE